MIQSVKEAGGGVNKQNQDDLAVAGIAGSSTEEQISKTTSSLQIDEHSDSSNYTWIGNHWIPPPGVPTFSADQMLEYYQNRNVLFIGDSTGRRAYTTLFAIMNSTDRTDVDVTSIDAHGVINIGKREKTHVPRCTLEDRQMEMRNSSAICRNLPVVNTKTDNTKNATSTENIGEKNPGRKGRFDYLPVMCYSNVYDSVIGAQHADSPPTTKSTWVFQDYDLVVFAMGAWETTRNRDCRGFRFGNGTVIRQPIDRLNMTLHALQAVSAGSPDLQIVFRTPGFMGNHQQDDYNWRLIRFTNNFFLDMKKGSESKRTPSSEFHEGANFLQVDWGTVVSKRSWDGRRIEGDMHPHYGLEARLLFGQQLMHELLLSDLPATENATGEK